LESSKGRCDTDGLIAIVLFQRAMPTIRSE
jgi:hypothetical protein